jgi:hypothetical protein
MNTTDKTRLKRELLASGASSAELNGLVGIADRLSGLQGVAAPSNRRLGSRRLRVAFGVAIPCLLGVAVGMLIVSGAQTVLPESVLYPVQKASDHVAVALDPAYRASVMMKRADQVQELVQHHAPAPVVLGTLADYQRQAASYASMTANYAAFEYCKHSLQQAAATAPAQERQAITSTLQSLSDV